jgi:serine protease
MPTTIINAPTARVGHSAVWTGSEMIIWGGFDSSFQLVNTGGRYCAQAGPPITLSAAQRKVEGINTVHLTWSGAGSRKIDVYRCVRRDDTGYDCNPMPIVTTGNDGAYTDSTGDTGRASYKYRVCEAGTSTCSNTAEVPK